MPEPLVLDPAEQRVLGSLLEKEVTVPASYPLSLNSLRLACNQATSRDPVTEYTDDELQAVTLRLQERRLVRLAHVSGGRGVKFAQRLSEILDLDAPARALITVLLLRGAQAPGELKTRTERLHPFADRAEVEACLAELAAAEPPLVREVGRLPGQQDARWIHLLGPVALAQAPEPERDVLAEGPAARDARVLAAYSAVADAYAGGVRDELDDSPFDAWLLGRIAEQGVGEPLADAGCGPGHVTARLKALGARAIGFDLVPALVERARAEYPGVRFEVGDLRALPRPGAGWAAIVARDSLIHLAPSELAGAVAALAGALRPGGQLAVSLEAGRGVRHIDAWWGRPVDLDIVRHDPDAVRAAFAAAGLSVEEWYLQGPTGEDAGERLHVLGRRSSGPA